MPMAVVTPRESRHSFWTQAEELLEPLPGCRRRLGRIKGSLLGHDLLNSLLGLLTLLWAGTPHSSMAIRGPRHPGTPSGILDKGF